MNLKRSVPSHDQTLHFAAVFFLFAPIGVLMMMVFETPQGWAAALFSAAFSGEISTGWAFAFVTRRWWVLAPVIAASLFLPRPMMSVLRQIGVFDIGMDLSPQVRTIVLAVQCVVFTSIGFVLLVVHLRRTEGRSTRAVAELDLARDVHRTLVPPITLTTPIAQVHGRSVASSSMGGDLIDVVSHDGRLDIVLGDVSGHGVGAGVVMAMLKSCVRTRLLHGAGLCEVVADANRVLADLTASNMFATFAALRLNPDRTLEYALAGHLPIYHYRAATATWEQYPNQNLPLGIDNEENFVSGAATLEPGDMLAMFTDGLTEVQNAAGVELGIDGVESLLGRGRATSLAALHEDVMAGVIAHGPQVDDQSMVLVRVT